MTYIANKKMNLGGRVFAKGEGIPAKVISAIAEPRLASLLRTRLVIAVEDSTAASGDMCPHCGEGPFQRLAQHVSMKHDDELLGLNSEEE